MRVAFTTIGRRKTAFVRRELLQPATVGKNPAARCREICVCQNLERLPKSGKYFSNSVRNRSEYRVLGLSGAGSVWENGSGSEILKAKLECLRKFQIQSQKHDV
jgi:hypothetical protein